MLVFYHWIMLYAANKALKKKGLVAEFSTAAVLNHAEKERYVDQLTLLGHIVNFRLDIIQGKKIFSHL